MVEPDDLVEGLHRLFVAFQRAVARDTVAFEVGQQRDNRACALSDFFSSVICWIIEFESLPRNELMKDWLRAWVQRSLDQVVFCSEVSVAKFVIQVGCS